MEFSFQFLGGQSVCIVEKVQNILRVDGECPVDAIEQEIRRGLNLLFGGTRQDIFVRPVHMLVAFIGSERRSGRQSVKAFTKIIDADADVW